MREISLTSKHNVVKLFLNGLSYDEIARQVGIAKGSVVNIISEFREGHLQMPPDMTEYVDALRQVAVDLRKSSTSIAQVQSCSKLELKLREMGASSDKAEQWLDICRDIASPTISTDQFVNASLELWRYT
jgi:transposase-like protein